MKKYNVSNGTNEKLVMFDYAVSHLARIKRVLKMKRGNMVLVGLGGSGKQSLTKFATFMNKLSFYTVEMKKNYKEP